MEIWKDSENIESIAREIARQPQSRAQVVEVAWQEGVTLWPVDHGEMFITVIKGSGLIRTGEGKYELEQGDQVHLESDDEFALNPIDQDTLFVVQMYWQPS